MAAWRDTLTRLVWRRHVPKHASLGFVAALGRRGTCYTKVCWLSLYFSQLWVMTNVCDFLDTMARSHRHLYLLLGRKFLFFFLQKVSCYSVRHHKPSFALMDVS